MTAFAILALVGILAGIASAIAGAGIGSALAPLLSLRVSLKLAIAAVAIPHLSASVLRFWLTRQDIDRRIFWRFGLVSAVASILGAWLHATFDTPVLTVVFAVLLILAGLSGLVSPRLHLHFGPGAAWIAGSLSGFLGGLVGEQGGFRSVALLGFQVSKESFIATATAVGMVVDLARTPVYLITQGRDLLTIWPAIAIMTAAVLAGTLIGYRLFGWIPEEQFRRVVSGIITIIGVLVLIRG